MYLGQSVTLDAAGTTGPSGFTYAWTVGTVPAGSTIATASLTGANTAKPSFTPDKLGAYAFTLTVSSGGQTSVANVNATAVDAPVFLFHTVEADGGNTPFYSANLTVTGALGSDSGAGTPVACIGSDAGSQAITAQFSATGWSDWWEAPAGQASKAVFVFETKEDGGSTTSLITATSQGACAPTTTKIDAVPGAPVVSQSPIPGFPPVPSNASAIDVPRISPDGVRVAYLRTTPDGSRVTTVAFDGTARHSLAPRYAFDDGGSNPDGGKSAQGVGARPVWINATTVAWVQSTSTGWQVVRATDKDNASTELVMSCDKGPVPTVFDVLPSGEVLTFAAVEQADANANTTDLVAYPVVAGTKACGTPRIVSKLVSNSGSSAASNFTVSPDKNLVAFLANDDVSGTSVIRIARVDGAGEPRQVLQVPSTVGFNSVTNGIRWVAGGAFITYGTTAASLDGGAGGSTNAIAVASLDGGLNRPAAVGASGDGILAIGTGSCSFGPAFGSGMSLFGIAGVLGLRLVRRRRRSE